MNIRRLIDQKRVEDFTYNLSSGNMSAEDWKLLAELLAEKENIILLHENEHGIYGEKPKECLDILETVNSPNLRCLFDPANFIIEGIKPYRDAYPILKDYIVYLHIKDAKYVPGKIIITPAGEGDGEVREILRALKKKGFDGFLSLEPHLSSAGKYQGFSGPDLFKKAAEALKKILEEIK
jgi:sugar phosphate isomerase/epimerase